MTSEVIYLTTTQLAERWQLDYRTLANWRTQRKGPKFLRFGSRVRYPMEAVIEYEGKQPVFEEQTNAGGAA